MSVRTRASLILVLTCAFWGLSFPLMKALESIGQQQLGSTSSLFLASLCVALRFSLAAIIMAVIFCRQLPGWTRLEVEQGAGIGVFGGLGLVLQMDGLAYTHASTSAFLTQAYCVLIPLWVGLRTLRLPPLQVWGACALAMIGAATLAGIQGGRLAFGRGEWETLAGSVFFTGQILWLERPRYAGNHIPRVTTLMFALMATATAVLALLTMESPRDLIQAYQTPTAIVLICALTLLCTLITFPLANFWQPKVSATQAGLLYSTEPIFASVYALVLPDWLSRIAGIQYSNETMTLNLMAGGALILLANIWLLRYPPPRPDHEV